MQPAHSRTYGNPGSTYHSFANPNARSAHTYANVDHNPGSDYSQAHTYRNANSVHTYRHTDSNARFACSHSFANCNARPAYTYAHGNTHSTYARQIPPLRFHISSDGPGLYGLALES